MRRPTIFAVLALLPILLAMGCGGWPKRVSEMDRSAISLAVNGVIKAVNAAIAAGDTAAIDSLYAPDASVLPANGPRVDGREAIHGLSARMLSVPGFNLVMTPVQTTVAEAGDMAVVTGTFDIKVSRGTGAPLDETGKFVTVFRPMGDHWRIALDTWNSDAPPSAPGR